MRQKNLNIKEAEKSTACYRIYVAQTVISLTVDVVLNVVLAVVSSCIRSKTVCQAGLVQRRAGSSQSI